MSLRTSGPRNKSPDGASESSSLVESSREKQKPDNNEEDDLQAIGDGLELALTEGKYRPLKAVDSPEDAGSGVEDDDDEDEERSLIDIAAKAAPSVEAYRQQILNVPAALKEQPEVQELLEAMEQVCKKAEAMQSVPRKPEQALDNVRAELEQRRQLIDALRQHTRDSSDDGDDTDLTNEVLHAIDSAHEAMQVGVIPSDTNKARIASAISELETVLDDLAGQGATEPWKSSATELRLKLNELKEIRLKAETYQSPHSVRSRLDERLVYVDAALRFFQSVLDDVPAAAKGRGDERREAFDDLAQSFIRRLEVRRDALFDLARRAASPSARNEITDAEGAHPELRRRLAEGEKTAFKTITLNDREPEADLMAAVIDAFLHAHPGADQRTGKQLIVLGKSRVLNEQRDWSVIESEVLVPVSSSPARSDGAAGVVSMAKVSTVTTPVGHIFGDDKLTVMRTTSAITRARLQEYRQQDPRYPDDPDKIIITGRNSHSTLECAHGVNVARTEMSADGKPLFSATRHGTLSAYGLYPDSLQSKPEKVLHKLYTDLQPDPPVRRATQICTIDDSDHIQQANDNPPPYNETSFDQLWNDATAGLDEAQFIDRARHDEAFCVLLRRKAALNRAREVFLSEVLGNPAMLKRIQEGKPVNFTSISLITPDRFRNFLAKIFPSRYRKHDELGMRRVEAQAWQDLQEALDKGQFEIDRQIVKATVISFSAGVNRLAQSSNWGPLGRSLTSGWNQVEDENRRALTSLIGSPSAVVEGKFGGRLGETMKELLAEWNAQTLRAGNASSATADEKLHARTRADSIRRQLRELEALGGQLAGMWISGDYRHAGEQPYKFAARIARLSFLMSGGTAFNCKSGKDRTAQLDLEVKVLSFQSEYRDAGHGLAIGADGAVESTGTAPPYVGRTDLDKLQLQAFVFQDRSRTVTQRHNTGAEGSKLGYWAELYNSFVPDIEDSEFIGSEFRGRSAGVPS